jgi:hypothetical protein
MASPKSRLPSWSEGLLRRLFRGFELEDRLGDLEEDLGERRGGSAGSNLEILAAILRLALAKARLNAYWSFGMLKNFVTIAFRNLKRDKVAAFITISGLSLGLSAFLLISRWVWHELSYDRFHAQAGLIYRVSERRAFPDHVEASFRTPGPLAAVMRAEVPEIATAVRVAMTGERVVRGGDKTYYEIGIITADPEFFEVFTFPLVQGRPETALADPLTIVLSQRMARKYFGTESPLGRTLVLDNRLSFRVSGVMRDVPSNSHLQFDAVVPFDVVRVLGWDTETWTFSLAMTYVRLGENVPPAAVETKIAGMVKARLPESNTTLYLQPLSRLHLHSLYDRIGGRGRAHYVAVFSLVGILVLVMACINFMNLTIARSERRVREIGLRRVVGAAKPHLVRQFLLEALLTAGLAVPFFIHLVLPGVNRIAGRFPVPPHDRLGVRIDSGRGASRRPLPGPGLVFFPAGRNIEEPFGGPAGPRGVEEISGPGPDVGLPGPSHHLPHRLQPDGIHENKRPGFQQGVGGLHSAGNEQPG